MTLTMLGTALPRGAVSTSWPGNTPWSWTVAPVVIEMTTVRLMSWLLRFDKAIAISKRRGTATKAWFASENGILVECVRVLSHGMRMGLWTTMKD